MSRNRLPENIELTDRLDLLVRLVQITDRIHLRETAMVVMPLLDDLTCTLIQALWLDNIEAGIPYGIGEMGLWRWATERIGIDALLSTGRRGRDAGLRAAHGHNASDTTT